MKIKTTIITALMGLVLMAVASVAQAADAPDYFGKAKSARAGALGSAFVAVSDASDSTYWNPAGLASLENTTISTTHSSLNDFDMTSDLFSVAMPLRNGRSAIGLGVYRSSISNIELVGFSSINRPSVNGIFTERELGLQFSYAVRISNRFSMGTTLKYLSVDIYDWSASGFGLDIGMLYDAGSGIKLGLNLQNVIPLDLGPDEIPFNAKIGVSYAPVGEKFIIAADLDTNVIGSNKDEVIMHVGAEYWIVPQIALRIGANDGDLTAGIGLARFGNWSFDYAYDDADVGDTHKFTVRFDFLADKRVKKVKRIIRKVKKKETAAQPAPVAETKPVAEKPAPKPAAKPAPKPKLVVEKKPEPKPEPVAVKKPAPKPVVEKKPEPKKPAAVTPTPEPKPAAVTPTPEPKPAAVKPAPKPEPVAVKPAPVKKKEVDVSTLSVTNAYSFYEEDTNTVSISYTDLTVGQSLLIIKDTSRIADVNIIEVGLLSSTGKIDRLYIDKITGYLIGDQISFK